MAAEVKIKALNIHSYNIQKDTIGALLSGVVRFEINSGTHNLELAVSFKDVPSPNQAVQAALRDLENFSKDFQVAVREARHRYQYNP